MWAVPSALLCLIGGATFFVLDATNAILNSADGELNEVILDPATPGYEIYVSPTPSLLALVEDETENLISVALISLFSNDIGGSLIVLPPELVIEEDLTLEEIYSTEGANGLQRALGAYVNVGFDALSVLGNDFWTKHFSVIGDLSVRIDDDLTTSEDGELNVVFEAGEISIPAEGIEEFLTWKNKGESPYNRWLRQQNFWIAWVKSAASFSGDITTSNNEHPELMRMISALTQGELVLFQPELIEQQIPEFSFTTNTSILQNAILEMIPFPIAAYEGARAKVKILDGVGGLDLPNVYVPPLVASGAQILLLGNAESFGVDRTQIIYHDKNFNDVVDDFSNALVGAELTYDPISETAIDVTVIIGKNSLELE